MKKILFISILLLSISSVFTSCSKDEDDGQCCWKFTILHTTSISPSMSGYPQTSTDSYWQCNLTAAQADDVIKELSSTTTTNANGYTITVKITVTKELEKSL